jgi:hypothetical protein
MYIRRCRPALFLHSWFCGSRRILPCLLCDVCVCDIYYIVCGYSAGCILSTLSQSRLNDIFYNPVPIQDGCQQAVSFAVFAMLVILHFAFTVKLRAGHT